MERIKVNAELRKDITKGATRRLRQAGLIPAVLYGKGEEPLSLSLPGKEFSTLLKGEAGLNALIELEIKAAAKASENALVMLKEYQTDAIRHVITHVDLLKINMKEKVSVKVPVHLMGKSVGVTNGGLVELIRREVEVRCLPGNIPEKIDVDITELDVGHSLHVKDLKLPMDVEVTPQTLDLTVVSIITPREEVIETPAAAEAGAAAPAGTEAAAGAPAAGESAAPAKGEKK